MAAHKVDSTGSNAAMERVLFRNLVGGGLIGALFYFASSYFSEVIDGVVESKYEWVSERFLLSISHIRTEWMAKGKPKQVTLNYHISVEENAEITVQLNKAGWPLNVGTKDRSLNCLNLWMLFAHESAHTQSMMDLTSYLEIETTASGCEYYHQKGKTNNLIFSYDVNSGKIDTLALD